MKSMSAKLRRLEQEPSPNAKHTQELKKVEAACTKLRGQLAEEKTARGLLEEQIQKLKSVTPPASAEEDSGRSTDVQKLRVELSELEKDKESLMGKLQFSMNNSRRLEQDLSKLQHYVLDLEAKMKASSSDAKPSSDEDSSSGEGDPSKPKTLKQIEKELAEKTKSEEEWMRKYGDSKKELKKVERDYRGLKGKLQVAVIKINSLKDLLKANGIEDTSSQKVALAAATGKASPKQTTKTKSPERTRNVPSTITVPSASSKKSPVSSEATTASSVAISRDTSLVDCSQNDFKISKGVKRGLMSTTPGKSEKRNKLSKSSSPGTVKYLFILLPSPKEIRSEPSIVPCSIIIPPPNFQKKVRNFKNIR